MRIYVCSVSINMKGQAKAGKHLFFSPAGFLNPSNIHHPCLSRIMKADSEGKHDVGSQTS